MIFRCLSNLPVLVWLAFISLWMGILVNLYAFGKTRPTLITWQQRYWDPDFKILSFWFFFGICATTILLVTVCGFLTCFEDCWINYFDEKRRKRSEYFGDFLKRDGF